MNYILVENLAKSYADKILFEDLSFGLNKGEKLALIANNGTGKSSLLKIIAGEEVPDSGTVTVRKDLKIGYLKQEPSFDDQHTINDLINSTYSTVLGILREYEEAINAQTEAYNDQTQQMLDVATSKMDEYNAWDYERRAKQILTQFGINDYSLPISQLSGGQKKRLALAMVLLDDPELLILDEPTNHLDIEMIEWLEKYLSQSKMSLLMVTHDRYFLDRICNNILEINNGKLYRHRGNYSYFIEKRAERETITQTEIDKAGKLMKKELEWVRRMPKARGTKSKSRLDAFSKIKDKANSGIKEQELKLEMKMSRVGGKVLEMKKVYKQYDNLKILEGFDYTFKKGERIGIVGKNGVGKSTFLNLITGKEKADSGKINVGDTIVYGYYDQKGIQLEEDKRVIEVLKEVAEVITLGNGSKLSASQFLQHFMFPPEMQYNPVSKLSGGERRRLHLLMVLIKNPNFLILDEPTNDLDLLTLTKLEEFLLAFKGCVIIVSHDRYFMDKLVDHLFIFEGEGIVNDYNGSYTEYKWEKEDAEEFAKQSKKPVVNEPPKLIEKEKNQKITYKEKLEFEQLEKEIAVLEKEKKDIETKLPELGENYEELQKHSNRLGEVVAQIDEKSFRWLELSEIG